jgi:hypothetical protein
MAGFMLFTGSKTGKQASAQQKAYIFHAPKIKKTPRKIQGGPFFYYKSTLMS